MLGSVQTGLGSVPTAGGDDSPGGGSGGGTLASIYAFGLSDDPTTDNFFGMPAGNLRFPGLLTWGANQQDASVEWFQDRAVVSLAQPPAYERVGMAANISGAGGNGCGRFRINELNDPAWNGTIGEIGSLPWIVETIDFSADATEGSAHSGIEYGRRTYNAGVASPYNVPQSQAGNSLAVSHSLYNSTFDAVAQVDQLSGYGQMERALTAIRNGANGQWITRWRNSAAAPAAGDGPAWIVDADGRFGHFSPRAMWQAQQLGADPVANAWGWAAYAYDGAGTLVKVFTVDNTGGTLLGQAIPTLDAGASLVETFTLEFDATVAADAGTWVPQKTGFVFILSRWSARVVSIAGVCTVAPVLGAGTTSPTFANYLTASTPLSVAQVNSGVGSLNNLSFGAFVAVHNADVHGIVQTPASGTGGFALRVRIACNGFWAPQ